MKKKIMHIVESFESGVFTFLVDLVNETDEEFDIVIVYGVRNETVKNFKEYFSNKVKFIKVENFTRSISPKKDLKAFFEIRKIIKNESPDIIHMHSSKAGFIGRFAGNTKKYKMIYNPHGFSFLMKNSSKIKRAIYWTLEKIGGLRNCTVIGCSYGEYKEALKLTKNAICINNGVNIEKLESEVERLPKKQIDFNNLKICTSGRIGYQKNPEFFNKIAEEFKNITFTWIGEGELQDKLTSPNITVTGWKSREEVLKVLNDNDIFILTSLWEGLPISLLEAMFLEKVCLVTNCIGNKDVIKQNENGFIITEENFKDIINTINKENYKRISINAKKDVLENYNTKIMVEKYRGVYNKE